MAVDRHAIAVDTMVVDCRMRDEAETGLQLPKTATVERLELRISSSSVDAC